MKRFFCIVFCLLLCTFLRAGLFGTVLSAEDRTEVKSWWCGETDEGSIYAMLYSDGELEIFCTRGTGEMNDERPANVPWADYRDQILKVTVKSGVTHIGNSAFYGCTKLTSVSLPSTLTSIGHSAFYNCGSLASVTVPSGVTLIEGYSFGDCSSLASITIPSSVTSIEYNSFQNCTSLKSIALPSKLRSLGDEVFLNCTSLTSIKLPSSLIGTGYNSGMFKGCTGLKSAGPTGGSYAIQFGWTDEIPDYMFRDSEITSITFPVGLKKIGEKSFYNCPGLTSLVLPDGMTELGASAFGSCTGLTSVKVPASLKTMGACPFNNCNKLKTAGPTGGSYDYQFGWTDAVPDNAFSFCKGLTTVNLPSGITSVGYLAFYYCEALTSVDLPESIQSIEKEAFSSCKALKSIQLSDAIQTIGEKAFYSCSSLTTVKISDLNAWCSISYGGNPGFDTSTPGHTLLLNGKAVTQLTFPADMPVNNYVFSGCTSLTKVIIPRGVTLIGDRAFAHCSGLTSVSIPTGLKTICTAAFVKCEALSDVYYRGTAEQLEKDQIEIYPNNLCFQEATLHCVATQLKPPEVTGEITSKGKPKLSWEAVDGAESYKIWRCTTSADGCYVLMATVAETSWTDSKAEAGQTYWYKVSTIDEYGDEGEGSTAVKLKATAGKPAAPTLKGKLTSKGKPQLSWKSVSGAAKYQVYRSTSKSGKYKLVKTTTSLKYTYSKAASGKTFYFKVRAVAEDGTAGSFSKVVKLTAKPAAPKLKAKLNAKGKPVLSWKAVTGAAKYQVYRSTSKNGKYKLIKTTTSLKYTNSKAAAGKTFYYKVRAVAKDGTKGSFSSVKKLKAK